MPRNAVASRSAAPLPDKASTALMEAVAFGRGQQNGPALA